MGRPLDSGSRSVGGNDIIHPGNVSRDSGEDGGLPGDITAHAGHKAGHSVDSILTVHHAVEGSPRITLASRADSISTSAHHGILHRGAPVRGAGADAIGHAGQVCLLQGLGQLPIGSGSSPACDVAGRVVSQDGSLPGQNTQLDIVIECNTLGQAQQGDVIACNHVGL